MNIYKIDLDLIKILVVVFDTRSVQKATTLLETTPPAIYRKLDTLRSITHNKLFIKSGKTLLPTPVCMKMVDDFKQAMSWIAIGFDPGGTDFSYQTEERTFTIAADDFTKRRILPGFIADRLGEVNGAPFIKLNTTSLPPYENFKWQIPQMLSSKHIDVAIFSHPFNEPTVLSDSLDLNQKGGTDKWIFFGNKQELIELSDLPEDIDPDTVTHVKLNVNKIESSKLVFPESSPLLQIIKKRSFHSIFSITSSLSEVADYVSSTEGTIGHLPRSFAETYFEDDENELIAVIDNYKEAKYSPRAYWLNQEDSGNRWFIKSLKDYCLRWE